MRDPVTAGVLALFLGVVGAHRFYLGQAGIGVISLVFAPTGLPALLGLFDGVRILSMTQEEFDSLYNAPDSATPGLSQHVTVQVPASSPGAELERLHRLHQDGALSESEFQAQKSRLLEGV